MYSQIHVQVGYSMFGRSSYEKELASTQPLNDLRSEQGRKHDVHVCARVHRTCSRTGLLILQVEWLQIQGNDATRLNKGHVFHLFPN
jgi:hypothetical protein